jgi:inner membrane protein
MEAANNRQPAKLDSKLDWTLEPITHFLTGACMARVGLNRKSALATATLVLAAEAPDIDVVAELRGGVFGFAHHRGITHTFVGAPVIALLVIALLWVYWRIRHRSGKGARKIEEPRWIVLFGLAWLAALTHILLDFTNSYGVRPFIPFSYKWYSWDTVFIYDPVLWIILGCGLILPKLFSMVDTEIGVRHRHPRGRVGAGVALVLLVAFWMFRDYEHRRALAAMEALTYNGQDAVRLSAYSYPVNPFRWYGLVETPGFFDRMEVDSRIPQVDPQGRELITYKPEETPVTLAAKMSYLGRVYLSWAQYPVTEVEELAPPRSGYVVRFFDLRYLYPDSTRRHPLSAWVQLDRQLNVVAQSFGVRDYPGQRTEAALGIPRMSFTVASRGSGW